MKRSVAAIHIAVILGLPCFAQASATVCPIENARYELMGDRDFTAGFDIRPTALNSHGELALFVKSAKSQFTYWFRLNFGNGYSTLSMTPLRQSTAAPNVGKLSDIHSEPTPLDDFQPLFLINQDLSFLPPEAARWTAVPCLSLPGIAGTRSLVQQRTIWQSAKHPGIDDSRAV